LPPKSNRLHPWDYDDAIYKKRNEIERLSRRLKGFRRIFSRFEKLDVLFLGFSLFRTYRRSTTRSVNTP
jgi:transposase